VDASIKGSTPNLISCGEKYLKAAALQIELTEILREIKTLTQRDDSMLIDLTRDTDGQRNPTLTVAVGGRLGCNRPVIPIPNANGKRTFPLAGRQTVKSVIRTDERGANKASKAEEVRRSFDPKGRRASDPFGFFRKEKLSPLPTATCKTLWIKGWERKKMNKLREDRCCLICGQKGHRMRDFIKRDRLFREEKFCFRPY
jgi:hypothetical protein